MTFGAIVFTFTVWACLSAASKNDAHDLIRQMEKR